MARVNATIRIEKQLKRELEKAKILLESTKQESMRFNDVVSEALSALQKELDKIEEKSGTVF